MRIYAERAFDGMSGRSELCVTLRDGIIVQVEENGSKEVADVRIDADHTLMPGLVDCHEHLSFRQRPFDYRSWVLPELPEHVGKIALYGADTAAWDIAHGITAVRSVGDKEYVDLVLRDAVTSGLILGPRILAAGPPISMLGGHGYYIGTEICGEIEAMRAARQLLKSGVDLIKIMASGGVGQDRPGEETTQVELTPAEARAVVDVASRGGVSVAAHSHGPAAIELCLDAGVRSIEHGSLITWDLAQRMKEQGTWLVPTISQIHTMATQGEKYGVPKRNQSAAREILTPMLEAFEGVLDSGVKIAAGTDTLGDIRDEVRHFQRAGMSCESAISSATSVAGELLNMPVGKLQEGYFADLIVVEGDPCVDVDCLQHVVAVIKAGEIVAGGWPGDVSAIQDVDRRPD